MVAVHGIPLELDDALRLAALRLRHPAPTSDEGLDALLRVCTDTVPGVEAAAISAAGHGRVHSTHGTDPAIGEVDAWHNRLRCGPLLEAAHAAPPPLAVVLVDDLVFEIGDDDVEVRVTPPFRALHSTTLCSRDGRRTALDLYASDPDTLGLDTTVLADMFARRATTLLCGPLEPGDDPRRPAVPVVGPGAGPSADGLEHLLSSRRDRDTDPVTVAELLVHDLARDARQRDAGVPHDGP